MLIFKNRKMMIALALSGLVHIGFLFYSPQVFTGGDSNLVSGVSVQIEIVKDDNRFDASGKEALESNVSTGIVTSSELPDVKEASVSTVQDRDKSLEASANEQVTINDSSDLVTEQEKKVQSNGNVNQFLQLVYQEISRHKLYPYMAKRQRREGLVKLNFVLHPDGQVTDVIIVQSSKFSVLDRAAQKAVEDISPFLLAADYLNYQQAFNVDVDFRLGKI